MKRFKLNAMIASLLVASGANAATIIDLHQSSTQPNRLAALPSDLTFRPIRTDVDFNHVAHQRLQQTYQGYPVWGAIKIIHTPANHSVTMDGKIFQGLANDLGVIKPELLSETQKAKALQIAEAEFMQHTNHAYPGIEEETVQPIVYLDSHHKAHLGFLTSFFVDDNETGAHRPTQIIDAETLRIQRQWDQVMTVDSNTTKGGGIGGNEKTGNIAFDDSTTNLFSLDMQSARNASGLTCTLQTTDIVITKNFRQTPISAPCNPIPNQHNNLPWLSQDNNGTRWLADGVNGGFSPSLDALYAAMVVKKLYQDWYQLPPLTTDGIQPMKMVMRVHYGRGFENAFWDGKKMNFGDGRNTFYPLTSLEVTAHEISHGFTQQHSNIDTSNSQMAGLHESFSDMAAMAAQYYLTKTNTWEMGRDILKVKGDQSMRYLDDPTKDGMSIDNMKNYSESLDPHLVCGVTNKAFYLLATTPGWDTHKAFNVMVKANMHYWSQSTADFNEVACGVISAANDYGYSVTDVKAAFNQVGIDTKRC